MCDSSILQDVFTIPFLCQSVLTFFHAFIICFFSAERISRSLKKIFPSGQITSTHLPEHKKKSGTPSMGGVGILLGTISATIFWATTTPWSIVACSLLTIDAIIGGVDDISKFQHKTNLGVLPRTKFLLQILSSSLAAYLIIRLNGSWICSYTIIPLLNFKITSSVFTVLLWIFIIVGTGNASNLTDGLDALCIRVLMPCFALAACLGFIQGHEYLAQVFHAPFTPYGKNICALCTAILGAGSAFLWHNAPPAKLFMGDTGSLALGSCLAFCFISLKQECLLAISGLVLVAETASVIIQSISFKTRGKTVFLCAPFHHHLQRKNISETTISIRLGTVSSICSMLGFLIFLLHAYLHQ